MGGTRTLQQQHSDGSRQCIVLRGQITHQAPVLLVYGSMPLDHGASQHNLDLQLTLTPLKKLACINGWFHNTACRRQAFANDIECIYTSAENFGNS